MALQPFKVRLTGDGSGTLGQVKVRIELIDFSPAAVQTPTDPDPDPDPDPELSLDDLSNVTIGSPQDGDGLVLTSGTWENTQL